MFHDGMMPDGYKVPGRSTKVAQPKLGVTGGLVGIEAVSGAMLEACGLGEMPEPRGHTPEQPAACFRAIEDIPGPSICLN